MQDNVCEVAILLATYNGEKHLEMQIDSLLRQTFQNFVCYICDDGSSDETKEIIRRYKESTNGKIKLITKQLKFGKGPTSNFFGLIDYALKYTYEPYILFCDQDDIWDEKKIQEQISLIKTLDESETCPHLVFCDQVVVDSENNIISLSAEKYSGRTIEDYQFKRLVFRNTVAGCTMCINRKLLQLMGEYTNLNNIVLHDWWAMLLASCFGKVSYIDIPLMNYRQHGKNSAGVDNRNYKKKIYKYLTNFQGSIKAKKIQTDRCKQQMVELGKIRVGDNIYISETLEFCEVCKRNKMYRMIYMLQHGYVGVDNLFTLFFV